MTLPYGPGFFSAIEPWSEAAAKRVLPLVFDLVRPASIVDVGCGSGVWLAEAVQLGLSDYLGIDGYAPAESLRIDAEHFLQHDLSIAVKLDRRFDLVLCLEVAEHLDPSSAEILVESLVGLGQAVVFSAAVPHQSGEHHVNEQWPDYWMKRFAAHGLVPVDAIRPQIWQDEQVPWWYRQNVLLFCDPALMSDRPELQVARAATRDEQLSLVHPELHLWIAHQRDTLAAEVARTRSLHEVLNLLAPAASAALRRRFHLRGALRHVAD